MTMFTIHHVKSATILTIGLLSAGLYGCGSDKNNHAEPCHGLDHSADWVDQKNGTLTKKGITCFTCVKNSSEMKAGKFDVSKDMNAKTTKKFDKAIDEGAQSCGHNEAMKLDEDVHKDYLKWAKAGSGKHDKPALPCAHVFDGLKKKKDESLADYAKRASQNASDDIKKCGKCLVDATKARQNPYTKCFNDGTHDVPVDPKGCKDFTHEVIAVAEQSESLQDFLNKVHAVSSDACFKCLINRPSSFAAGNDVCGLQAAGDDLKKAYEKWVANDKKPPAGKKDCALLNKCGGSSHGTCQDGACVCKEGWTGDQCEKANPKPSAGEKAAKNLAAVVENLNKTRERLNAAKTLDDFIKYKNVMESFLQDGQQVEEDGNEALKKSGNKDPNQKFETNQKAFKNIKKSFEKLKATANDVVIEKTWLDLKKDITTKLATLSDQALQWYDQVKSSDKDKDKTKKKVELSSTAAQTAIQAVNEYIAIEVFIKGLDDKTQKETWNKKLTEAGTDSDKLNALYNQMDSVVKQKKEADNNLHFYVQVALDTDFFHGSGTFKDLINACNHLYDPNTKKSQIVLENEKKETVYTKMGEGTKLDSWMVDLIDYNSLLHNIWSSDKFCAQKDAKLMSEYDKQLNVKWCCGKCSKTGPKCTKKCPKKGQTQDPQTCECICSKTCTDGKTLDKQACECICSKTCTDGKTLDKQACECICTKTCPDGQTLDKQACTCKKPKTCSKTCTDGKTLDKDTCTCICSRTCSEGKTEQYYLDHHCIKPHRPVKNRPDCIKYWCCGEEEGQCATLCKNQCPEQITDASGSSKWPHCHPPKSN